MRRVHPSIGSLLLNISLFGCFLNPAQAQTRTGNRPANISQNTNIALPQAGAITHGIDIGSIFLEAVFYDAGGQDTGPVVAADVNGDGKLDMIVVNRCDPSSLNCANGTVAVRLGNGDGSFQSFTAYPSGGFYADAVVVADVNDDGKPDLLVTNQCVSSSNCGNGIVAVLLGNGDGTFQPAATYSSGGYSPDAIAVADVNGDGKPDLLVANLELSGSSAAGVAAVLLGNGNGTFQPATTYSSGGYLADSIAVADVNGDGKPDLLMANQCASLNTSGACVGGGMVAALLGNGDGTFQPAVTYPSGGTTTNTSGNVVALSIVVADVNGDGKPDLLVTNQCATGMCGIEGGPGSIGVLLGNGDGTFQPAVTYSSGGYDAMSITVADVNGDGRPDLLVNNQCQSLTSGAYLQLCFDPVVGVLLGNGDGTFQAPQTYDGGGAGIAIADLNGDSKPDLLVSSPSGGYCQGQNTLCDGAVAVMLGEGNGTFQAAQSFNSGGGSTSAIVVGDANGDGIPDLLVANSCCGLSGGPGGAAVLLGNGDGTFQTARQFAPSINGANSIAAADLNGDGKLDLLLTYGGLAVLLGNGDGTFQDPQMYSPGTTASASSIAVADVNGDGNPDLLVSNRCSSCTQYGGPGELGVLLGNGDGTFQPVRTYSSGGVNAGAIAVADVNGDGVPDLVVANECTSPPAVCSGNDGAVGILLGNGDGTFQPSQNYDSGGYYASGVAVADINADGKPDLIVSNQCVSGSTPPCNGSLGVLLGNGDGTFQPAIITIAPLGFGFGRDTAVVDFDGDGHLDVFGGQLLLFGNGDGTFQAPINLDLGGVTAVGDFNQDGKPDLAEGGVTILLNESPFPGTLTKVVSSLNPATVLEPITLAATVTGQSPTGSVTFYKNGSTLSTAPLVNGQASYTLTFGQASTKSITASYSGDANNRASTSLPFSEFVKQAGSAASTTTVVATPNPALAGQPVTLTVTVSGSSPTGEVTFTKNGATLATVPLVNGQATYTQAYAFPSTKAITASYYGDVNNQASASAVLNLVVNPATTTTMLFSNLNPSLAGQSVTFTATVTSSTGVTLPDGELVSFSKNGSVLASVPLISGQASYTQAFPWAGTKSITASYAGDATYQPSTSAVLSQVVNQATSTTTLVSSLNPAPVGQLVMITATVTSSSGLTPPDGGVVTFTKNGVVVATVPLAGGQATYSQAFTVAGVKDITASYAGDVTNQPSTSADLIETVN